MVSAVNCCHWTPSPVVGAVRINFAHFIDSNETLNINFSWHCTPTQNPPITSTTKSLDFGRNDQEFIGSLRSTFWWHTVHQLFTSLTIQYTHIILLIYHYLLVADKSERPFSGDSYGWWWWWWWWQRKLHAEKTVQLVPGPEAAAAAASNRGLPAATATDIEFWIWSAGSTRGCVCIAMPALLETGWWNYIHIICESTTLKWKNTIWEGTTKTQNSFFVLNLN